MSVVDLNAMRDEMMPGLRALAYSFKETKEIWAANIFNAVNDAEFKIMADLAELPAPSLQVALAMGAAVAVIKNPPVSRRGLVSWVSNRFSGLDMDG